MSTIFKSILNNIFQLTENRAKKRPPQRPYKRRSYFGPYLGYPPKQPLCGARLLGCREEVSSS